MQPVVLNVNCAWGRSFTYSLLWSLFLPLPEVGIWRLGCLNPDFRRQGMSAKFTIFKCSQEMDLEENNNDYYDESLPKDYMTQANVLQPRSFRKKRKRLPPCAMNPWDDAMASLEDDTFKANLRLPPCLQQPDQLAELNSKKNSTNLSLPSGETVNPGGFSSPSPQESSLESLPSKAFPVEEEPSGMSTMLKQIFQGHQLSGNLSLGREEPLPIKGSSETTTRPRPMEGTEMTPESVERGKAVEDMSPPSALPLERLEALLEHHAATVHSRESFDGEALKGTLTLKVKESPLHIRDNLSIANQVDRDFWFPERVSHQHVDTAERWNTAPLISNMTLTEAFGAMSHTNASTSFNRSIVSASLDGLKSKVAIQDMSLETQNSDPLTLEINAGVDALASQGHGTTSQDPKSYSTDEAVVQEDGPSATTALLQPASLLVSTTPGTQGILSEDLFLGSPSAHTASQEKAHDIHSQDHETEKIMRLGLNEAMGDTKSLKERNSFLAQNGDSADSDGSTNNLSMTDRDIGTNDILNSNDRFSTHPSGHSKERESLTLQGGLQEATQGKHLSGRENEASPRFQAAPNEIRIQNVHRVLGALMKPNITQHRLAETTRTFPKGSEMGGKDAFSEEGAPPPQPISLANVTGPEELIRKRRSKRHLDFPSREKPGDERKKTTCSPGHQAGGGPLKKRSLETPQVTLEGADARVERRKNSSDKAEGQPWALLNNTFFRASSHAMAATIRAFLVGNAAEDNQTSRSGHTTVSNSPPPNSTEYSPSQSENMIGSPSDSRQRVTQDGDKEAWGGGSSPQITVDANEANIVPGYSRNEMATKVRGTEEKAGVGFTVFAKGKPMDVHLHPQKNMGKRKEGGLPATIEVPSMRQADPEPFLPFQLQESHPDQEETLRKESLQDITKREEVASPAMQDPEQNNLPHRDYSAMNQGEEGSDPPSAFQRKKEEEEEKDGIQGFNQSKSMAPGNRLNMEVPLLAYNSSRPAETNSSKHPKETSDYDDYSNIEENLKEFDIYGEDDQDPRGFVGKVRQYYIAAVEVMWDYGSHVPSPFLRDK